MSSDQPVWTTPIARRPLLIAAGVAAGAAALPAGRAQAAPRTAAAATSPVDAISAGTWLAGDTHVHDDHSSDGSFIRQIVSQQGPGTLSVADQIGEGERIGLDWMPLTDHRTYDQHWDPQWTSSALLLVPGEEANGAPHATCLGAIDVVVDGANPPGSAAHRHVQQSIWEAHAQGASWGIAHPGDINTQNDSVLGAHTVETWNRASAADVEVDWAENAWNKGYRMGAAGACDCHFKELWGVAGPGMPTTWVLAKTQTERAVLDGLRAGHTTLSSSPVGAFVTLEADANGDGVFEGVGGDELVVTGTTVKLRVRVQRAPGMTLLVYGSPGRSAVPLLQVVVTTADETHLVDVPMQGQTHWWRAEVRGYGPPSGMTTDPQADVPKSADQLQAMTSPIFATTGAPAVPQPAIPLPPLSGSPSGAVVELGGTSWHGFPDVTVGPDGTHVVAEEHGDGVTSVVHVAPDGTRTVIASGAARFPKVAAQGAQLWVVFQDEGSQLPRNPQIYLTNSVDGGKTFRQPARISDGRGRQERPAIAMAPHGPVIAWQAATGSAVEVMTWMPSDGTAKTVSDVGKVITPPNAEDSRSARYPASLFPDIVVVGNTAVVSWQDNRNDPDPLWTGHLDPGGITDNDPTGVTPSTIAPKTDPDTWEPMVSVRRLDTSTWTAPIRVAARDDRAQCHPALGAAADGTLVCAWDSRLLRSSGTSPVITAATSSDGGLTWTPPVLVDEAPGFFAQRPRLATDPDGTARMVWYDARGDDWRWAVRTAVLVDGAWQPQGEVIRGGSCTWPAVDSGVVVAATDRASQAQRDQTQQVVLATVAGGPNPVVPEIPLPVVLPVLAAGLTAVLARARRTADRT